MSAEVIRFEDFELDGGAFQLRRAGQFVPLERIPLQLLFLLAERPGKLVTREEIVERIWGKDVFLDADNGINTAVRKIRKALKDDPDNPRLLHTVTGSGYRFAAQSVEVRTAAPRLPAPTDKQKIMLAVLPFENMSADPQQEYFADGMTEEVITQLGSLDPRHLGVIARTSAMKYKGARKDIAQIAQELGVDYLLEGSVRRANQRVRVTAQLILAKDQTHLWAGSFDRDLSDVLKLQSDIARATVDKIQLTLSQQVQERLAGTRSVDPEAHDAYLLGLQTWYLRTKDGDARAIAEFGRAINIDPNYAPAYAGLSRAYSLAPVSGLLAPSEALLKARAAAERAVALDDSLADGHTALAFVKAHFEYDWPAAGREFCRAIELNPSNAFGHFFYSNSYLSPLARHDEAVAEMKKATEMDPFSPPIQSFLGRTYVWGRRYDDALEQFRKVVQMFPNLAIGHVRLAHLYAYTGKLDDAISEETKARLLAGEDPRVALKKEDSLRQSAAVGGIRGYWEKILEFSQMKENPPESFTSSYGLAIIHAWLGKVDKAVELLEKALADRELAMTEIGVEPAFDPLRSHPRFQALLRRTGLAP